jgi:hypothetical protein
MIIDPDDKFFERADAYIHLANDQVKEIESGKVSASMMFAVARFNAWVNAGGFQSAKEMEAAKKEAIEYFSNEYRKMLEENLDDYIANFNQYMGIQTDSSSPSLKLVE